MFPSYKDFFNVCVYDNNFDFYNITDGKEIFADIYFNDIKVYRLPFGTLNQIKDLHKIMKNLYNIGNGSDLLGNALIYPGEIEVKKNDERTFSEIGIRDNFICKMKLKQKEEN